MSEQVQSESTADSSAEGAQQGAFDETKAKERISKLSSEAKNLRERVRALEAYETQAKEAEQAKLSVEERFAAQLSEVARRADAAESRLARLVAARAAGLPDDLADRLVGDTPEALEADAVRLAELFGAKQEDTEQRPVRRGDPSQGSDPMSLNGVDGLEKAMRHIANSR